MENINTIVLNTTFEEMCGVMNDYCPICKRKFITPSNIVKLGNVAYDLECYFEANNSGIKVN